MQNKKYIIFDLEGTLIQSSISGVLFYPGVVRLIKTLSKKYKLFISTQASDTGVISFFQDQGFFDYFEYILGSNTIQKSPEHIDFFQTITLDNDFTQQAVFIGDSQIDKYIAREKNIDFIALGDLVDSEIKINNIEELLKIL